MKNTIRIIKEFPIAAALCAIADIAVTVKYTAISATKDPTSIVYLIALYGAITTILIIIAGINWAKNKTEKEDAENRRKHQLNRLASSYCKEFYSITNISE